MYIKSVFGFILIEIKTGLIQSRILIVQKILLILNWV